VFFALFVFFVVRIRKINHKERREHKEGRGLGPSPVFFALFVFFVVKILSHGHP
jgi:hypothetical protein